MVQVSSFEGFDEELLTRQQGDNGRNAHAQIELLATPFDVGDEPRVWHKRVPRAVVGLR